MVWGWLAREEGVKAVESTRCAVLVRRLGGWASPQLLPRATWGGARIPPVGLLRPPVASGFVVSALREHQVASRPLRLGEEIPASRGLHGVANALVSSSPSIGAALGSNVEDGKTRTRV